MEILYGEKAFPSTEGVKLTFLRDICLNVQLDNAEDSGSIWAVYPDRDEDLLCRSSLNIDLEQSLKRKEIALEQTCCYIWLVKIFHGGMFWISFAVENVGTENLSCFKMEFQIFIAELCDTS